MLVGDGARDELPTVAVVVPAHGSTADLERVLACLDRQTHPRQRMWVVVAVDGPDPALERAAAAADRVVVLPTNQGSYAARNAAIEVLPDEASVVCFTDSDCLPDPGWVTAHVAALAGCDMSGGAIEVTLRPKPSPAEFVDRHRHLKQHQYVTVEGYAATANLAVRRDVLKTQRFNPALRSGGDADFGRLATAAGYTLAYAEDAVVRHPARTTTREVRKKVKRIATGIRANPERWRDRGVPPRPRNLNVPRFAYRGGVSKNPLWLLHALALEQWAAVTIRRAVVSVKRQHGLPR